MAALHLLRPHAQWSGEFGFQDIEIHGAGGSRLALPVSDLEELLLDIPRFGMAAGDVVGHYVVQVPHDSDLRESIIDYNNLFTADEAQLRKWFAGKVVVLADLRAGRDGPFPYPDGRQLAGAFLHASAVEQLLQGRWIRRTLPVQVGSGYFDAWYLLVVGAGTVGMFLGLARSRRRGLGVATAFGGASVGALAFVVAFRLTGVLLSPLVPLVAFASVAALVRAAARLRRPLI
jgi:hypothetical protein